MSGVVGWVGSEGGGGGAPGGGSSCLVALLPRGVPPPSEAQGQRVSAAWRAASKASGARLSAPGKGAGQRVALQRLEREAFMSAGG